MLLEQGMAFAPSLRSSATISAHMSWAVISGIQPSFGLGLGRIAQQGFNLGRAEIPRIDPHHHIANLERRGIVAR